MIGQSVAGSGACLLTWLTAVFIDPPCVCLVSSHEPVFSCFMSTYSGENTMSRKVPVASGELHDGALLLYTNYANSFVCHHSACVRWSVDN